MDRIQFRRSTSGEWSSINPILAGGEFAFETDTRRFKVGDGVTAYNNLNYVSFDGGSIDSSQMASTTTTAAPTTTTAAPPATSLPGMNIGGWGDPNLYVRKQNSLNASNPRYGTYMARWSDNKSGADGLAEIMLLNMQTTTHSVKIFYTNKDRVIGSAVRGRRISSIRVELNGVSTTYTNYARITAGPISIRISKLGSGANSYLNFDLNWSRINNLVSFRGALSVVLKRIAATNGYWNGGSGSTRDGFGIAAALYGLSRSSFHTTNLSMLSQPEDELTTADSSGYDSAASNTTDQTLFHEGVVVANSENGPEVSYDSNVEGFSDIDSLFANNVEDDNNQFFSPPGTTTTTTTPAPQGCSARATYQWNCFNSAPGFNCSAAPGGVCPGYWELIQDCPSGCTQNGNELGNGLTVCGSQRTITCL